MKDRDELEIGRNRGRGFFERPKNSGTWWICYFDENGRKHREKVSPKSLALKVYQKRKNEIAERRLFPERIRRRELLLSEVINEYFKRIEKRPIYREAGRYGRIWSHVLGSRTLRQITPGDIERHVAKRSARTRIRRSRERRRQPLPPR